MSFYQESEIFYYSQFSSFNLIPNQYYYIPLISDIYKLKSNSFVIKQIPNGLKFDNKNGMISGSVDSASKYFQSTLYYSEYPKYHINTTIIFGNSINENGNMNSGIFVNYVEIDRNIHRCDKRMNIRELKIVNQDILNEMKEERDDSLYGSYYEFYLVMKESKNIEFRLSSYGNSIMHIDEYENEIMSTRSCDYNYERREMRLESGKHYIRIEYYPSSYKYEIKLEMSDKKEYKVLNNENSIIYGGIISNVKYEEITMNRDSFIFSKPEILSGNVIEYKIKSKIPNGLNINSKNGIISGMLEECVESMEIEVICIGISNSIESRLIIHCNNDNNDLENDYSMEIRRIQDDIYDKTMKLNSFIHNPVIFVSNSIKNNNISLNEINVNLSSSSYIITYEGIIEKEMMNEIKSINVVGEYERMKMIITNEKEYIYDNNIDKDLYKNLTMNMKSEYNSNIKIIINVKNIKDFKSISMKVNMKMNLLSILKRVSINSFHYPSKYITFFLVRSISPIINNELFKSINNATFKFKVTPSFPSYTLLLNEITGRISFDVNKIKDMYNYVEYTITMYNDEISYSYSMYLRVFYAISTIVNVNDDFLTRNDRFYYPLKIEGIYTSCGISDNSSNLKLLDDCVLSGYIDYIRSVFLCIYYYEGENVQIINLHNTGYKNPNFVVIVDILDLETNIEIDIYDKNKVIIKEQTFNHSYVSMNLYLYEGIYYLSYKILYYDEEKIYNNTITYGFTDKSVIDEINGNKSYEIYQFNIPFNENMEIWYDEIIFEDENEKYIDLYPHLNNPYTYEMNRDKFKWKIKDNPERLNFNKSNGRIYGIITFKDDFEVDCFYEDLNCNFLYNSMQSRYFCYIEHFYFLFFYVYENKIIGCENGYYGSRTTRCVFEENSDNTRLDVIDSSNCKKVKIKPENENEVIIIMSMTIHLIEQLFIEYEESVWINRQVTEYIDEVERICNATVDEISVLNNNKDLESGNVSITFQYTTIKKDIKKSLDEIKSIFSTKRYPLYNEYDYYFQGEPFYVTNINIIQFHKSNDLYWYIGVISVIVIVLDKKTKENEELLLD